MPPHQLANPEVYIPIKASSHFNQDTWQLVAH